MDLWICHFHKDIKMPFNWALSEIKGHMPVVMIKCILLTSLITYGLSTSPLSSKINYLECLFSFNIQ